MKKYISNKITREIKKHLSTICKKYRILIVLISIIIIILEVSSIVWFSDMIYGVALIGLIISINTFKLLWQHFFYMAGIFTIFLLGSLLTSNSLVAEKLATWIFILISLATYLYWKKVNET